jgi:glycogen debranching enzyme
VAGLPWYAVPFGRDSLIAALQALPIRPELAKAVIRTMARFQGTKEDAWRDEEPGKIMHEIRFGELARSGQIPFTPYYGTIDATPLFLILIAEVYRFTGDLDFVREFAESAKRAFEWIDKFGDPDRSGYTSYVRKSEKGIDNQGWKDSGESVVHRDGRLAEAPIALCEVQGYVYMARRQWSELFRLLGDNKMAERLAAQAEDLKRRFNRDFWMEDEQFVALALDRQRRQVGTVTSNPGHCLMTGILDEEKARHVASRLLAPDLFNGWGIRTMSSQAVAYNPMSYHNGSVWPHDNSLILLGLQEMGFHEEASRLMEGLISAASHFEDYRLPELFCGYGREEGEPVPYPVACSPQAWAAGTVFVLLRTMLGLKPEPEQKRIVLSPVLPDGIGSLRVRRLCVGNGHLDVNLVRADGKVHVSVDRNTTGWSVVIS